MRLIATLLIIIGVLGCTKDTYSPDVSSRGTQFMECEYDTGDLLSLLTVFGTSTEVQLAWIAVYHNHTEELSELQGPNNYSKINGVYWFNLTAEEQAEYEWEWLRDGVVLSTLANPNFNELAETGFECIGVFELTLRCTKDGVTKERTEWVSYSYNWLSINNGGTIETCGGDIPSEQDINWPFYPAEQWDLNNDNQINTGDILIFLVEYC